ncbi:unnamed protein product [Rangifer tarandus platyrhynchus]|uniref:Uncharacterized protein n=2 Tax=Rangifer tarandus platyrhynchus TaxID=3082113 RepID=A0ABN8XRJ6_RANTA|nr:unnamed protein product [Rangifer tarandus platyrhynchus]
MYQFFGLPDGPVGKESAWDPPRDPNAGLIPGSRRSPGGGNDKLLQYSCLKNPMDRGAWQATVQRVAKSQTPERLKTHTHTHKYMHTHTPLFHLMVRGINTRI